MIKAEHVRDDLKVLDEKMKKGEVTNADILKSITLLIKLLVDVRTNQTIVLRKDGLIEKKKEK
jgi:hypothetical protein